MNKNFRENEGIIDIRESCEDTPMEQQVITETAIQRTNSTRQTSYGAYK